MLRLQTQAWLWTSAFVLYAAIYSACAFWVRKTQSEKVERETETVHQGGEELGRSRPALWIAASFFASTLLLSTTNYICQEVAVIPFLWVLPLSVYLLSFILTFEGGNWYNRNFFHALLALSVVWVVLVTPLNANYSYITQTAACVLLLFAGCMVCHGEAFRLRPSSRSLTKFYLSISSGGALGGIFVNLLAPLIFPGYWEYPLSILGTAGLLLFIVEKDGGSWLHKGKLWLAVAMASVIVLLATMELAQVWPQSSWFTGVRPRLIVVGLACLALALFAKSRQEKQESNAAPFVRISVAVVFLLFITGFILPIRDFYTNVLAASRNFYGVLTVVLDKPDNYLTLWHGKTAHGFQFLQPGLEHVEIRAVRIHHYEIPDFMRARGEKDLFPVSRPIWVIGIVTRNVLENVNFPCGNIDNRHPTHITCGARFFDCVKRNSSSIGRDRGKYSVGDLFLTGAVKIGDVNRIVALEGDVPITAKN